MECENGTIRILEEGRVERVVSSKIENFLKKVWTCNG